MYQEVLLTPAERARVNNIVDFGAKIGTLKVVKNPCKAWNVNLGIEGLHCSIIISLS